MTKIVPPEGYSISYDMGGPNGDGYTVDKLLCRITLTDNSLTIAHVYLRNGKLSAIVYELRSERLYSIESLQLRCKTSLPEYVRYID